MAEFTKEQTGAPDEFLAASGLQLIEQRIVLMVRKMMEHING